MGFYDDLLASSQQGQQNMQSDFGQDVPMQQGFGQGMPMQQGFNQGMPMQQCGYPNQMSFGQPMTPNYGVPMQQGFGQNYGYNQGYDYQQGYNQGYGYNQPMGRVDSMGFIRYSKQEILQGLRNYVMNYTQRDITKEEKIEEYPNLLRHACTMTDEKISQLGICYFQVPEMQIQVPFYFCTACGKLYYYKDFM